MLFLISFTEQIMIMFPIIYRMVKTITYFLLTSCLFSIVQTLTNAITKLRTGETSSTFTTTTSLNSAFSVTFSPSCVSCNMAFANTRLSSEVLVSKVVLKSMNDTSFTLQVNRRQPTVNTNQYFYAQYIVVESVGFMIVGNQVVLDSKVTNCNQQGSSLAYSIKSNLPSGNATVLEVFVFLQNLPIPKTGTEQNVNLTGFVSEDGKKVIVCSPFPLDNLVNTLSVSYVIHINDSIYFIKFKDLQLCTNCSPTALLARIGFVPTVFMYGLQSARANTSASILLSIFPLAIKVSNLYGIYQLNMYESICPYHSTYSLQRKTCQCDSGYCYDIRNKCVNCTQFCAATSALGCLECTPSLNRVLVLGVCLCEEGYYQDSSQICQKCSVQCVTCLSYSTDCLTCNAGYVMIDGICQIALSTLTPSLTQTVNNVVATLTSLNTTITINSNNTQIDIATDNTPVNNPNITILANKIITSFTLNGSASTLTISISNKNSTSRKVVDRTNSVLLSLEKMYFYSEPQKAGLATSCKTVSAVAQSTNFGRSVLVILGGMYILADMIEFVNLVAYYIFINMSLPSNLRLFLEMLYSSLQYSIIPVDTPDLFNNFDDDFVTPQIYDDYDYSLNFISHNTFPIVQLLLFLFIYVVLGKLVARLKGNNFLSCYCKSQYSRIYTNTSEALLSCHLPLCFASATVLLDRSLNNYYKAANFGCAVFSVFVVGIIPLFHPIYLYSVKRSRKENTEDSYAKTKRSKQWSEVYIFSKCLLCTVLAISIPLCPPLLTILLLLTCSVVQIFAASKCTFKTKLTKVSRMIYIATHTLLHVILLIIFVFNQVFYNLSMMMILGYMAIGLILLNIGHEFFMILAELLTMFIDWVKEKIRNRKKNLIEKKHSGEINQEMTLHAMRINRKRIKVIDSPDKTERKQEAVGQRRISRAEKLKNDMLRVVRVLRIRPRQSIQIEMKDSSPTPY